MLTETVRSIYGFNKTLGTYGVEVEVEGDNLPAASVGFIKEHDGSLRGESAEYVFKGPVSKKGAVNRINNLYKAYEETGTKVRNSYRCSVHVHMNVQEFTMTQVANLFVLYATFEEYLVKYCGEHREGNLFCLRLSDAEYTVQTFIKGLVKGRYDLFQSDNLRYAAINIAALAKYGSMEFRAMRGTDSAKDIIDWINLLDCLHVAARKFKNPLEIVEQASLRGCDVLADDIFGDLLELLPLEGNWADVMFENIRMVQDVAYQPTYPEEGVDE